MVVPILCIVMILSVIIGVISFLLSACDEGIKSLYMSFRFFALSFICIIILSYYMVKHPQPTFREVCEANNGTYIDNNGKAGDSCIYNK